MGRRARIGLFAGLALAVAMAIVLVPAAREARRERAAAEARELAERRVQVVRLLKAEQRPRHGRAGPAPANASARDQMAARAAAVRDLQAAIVADARERVRAGALSGPILRATCDPFPATVGQPPPQEDLARRHGGYACVAVTTEIAATRKNEAGVLGHPYRASLDFHSGRFAFCKVAGRPDPIPDPEITTPRECSA